MKLSTIKTSKDIDKKTPRQPGTKTRRHLDNKTKRQQDRQDKLRPRQQDSKTRCHQHQDKRGRGTGRVLGTAPTHLSKLAGKA